MTQQRQPQDTQQPQFTQSLRQQQQRSTGPYFGAPEPGLPGLDLNEFTFPPMFIEDLDNTEDSALIQAPYLKFFGMQRFASAIERCVARGVRVDIFLQEPWQLREPPGSAASTSAEAEHFLADLEYLRSLGVHVTLRPDIHMKVIVIDGKILYRGSLNILSYSMPKSQGDKPKNDGTTRWISPIGCADAVEEFHLDRCAWCIEERKHKTMNDEVFLSDKNLRKLILHHRKAMGLSQQQLATKVKTDRSTISDLEKGQHLPSFPTLLSIWEALGRNLGLCPASSESMLVRINRRASEVERKK
jgi:DNA-binding XRE family transcriptional regulator